MHKQKHTLSKDDRASLGLASAIYAIGLLTGLIISLLICAPIKVNAAESSDGIYSLNYSYMQNANTQGQYYGEYRISLTSQYPLFIYQEKGDTWSNYKVGFFNGTKANIWSTDTMTVLSYYRAVYEKNGNLYREETGANIPISGATGTISVNDSIGETFVTGGFIFDSLDSATAYYVDGDMSGVIQEAEKFQRGFDSEYDETVPIPQLTNLSHNGFTVANAADNLEIDLIVKSTFYGLKHQKHNSGNFTNGGISGTISGHNTDFMKRDESWVYAQHYEDLTFTADIGYTKSSYYLPSDFDYNNTAQLCEDGWRFLIDYPKHTDLPDYEPLKHSIGNSYANAYYDHTYLFGKNLSQETCVTALKYSKQAVTKFYVRFIEVDMETGLFKEGQWYCYTYNDDGLFQQSGISVSPVLGDENGNPVEVDRVTGVQDSEGNVTFGSDYGYNFDTGDFTSGGTSNSFLSAVQSFLGDLESFQGAFTGFTELMTGLFGFIPESIWRLIGTGITAVIIVMVVKVLRG